MRLKLTALFVAFALSTIWFGATKTAIAPGYGHSMLNGALFYSLHNGFFQQPHLFLDVWRTRVVNLWLTGVLVNCTNMTAPQIVFVFGLWQAVWLMATFAVVIAFLKEPTYIIFALFSSLVFTYCFDLTNIIIMPWDRPALFFWTLSICLWHTKRYRWMVAAIIVGALFKESVALSAVLLFFTGKTLTDKWHHKSKLFACTFVGCLTERLLLAHFFIGHNQVSDVSCSIQASPWTFIISFFKNNILNSSLLWMNCGLIVVMFFFWPKKIEDWGVWCITILFAGLMFVVETADSAGGAKVEPRQWVEIMPMLVIYLQQKVKV